MKRKNILSCLCAAAAAVLLFISSAHAQGAWQVVPSGTTQNLNGISGLAADNIYAVGAGGTIIKYNGSSWSAQPSGTTWNLNNVWAVRTNNIYAVGDYRGIFRSNGSTWSKIHSQATNYPLYGIAGPDANNGKMLAVGKNNTIWVLFVPSYYNMLDGSETSFGSQEQHEHNNDLYGAFYSESDKNVLMVGSKGIIGWYAGYDFWGHNNMDTMTSPVTTTLRAIWAVNNQNFFAVGDGGVIVRKLNNGAITKMTSNTTANLRAVWGTDMNNVYAVGANGTVMRFNGSTWSKITVPTTAQLNGIWGVSVNEIYAVGNGGSIIKYVGSQVCFCPDDTTSVQYRKADNSGWEKCQCTYYKPCCDPVSGLCWQDPQKDAGTSNYGGIVSYDAVRYCDELVTMGYDDWRLPNVDELRSLIRGNPDTMTGGACPMVDGSTFEAGQDTDCYGSVDGGGPGVEGCYWPAELTGSCHRPDPGTNGIHALEYWAEGAASNPERQNWIASVLFDIGGVTYNHINSLAEVRCIRDEPTVPVACEETVACTPNTTRECTAVNGKIGAQTCNTAGTCWGPCESTAFENTPPDPDPDVCDQCDQLTLTIRVPEHLNTPPAQLMAFWYTADGWTGMPAGPPDGGTSDNVIQNPAINDDQPYTITVPGCTYYRESCLAGDYQLYVGLYYSSEWPPLPQDGDYIWGTTAPPVTLGGGPQQNINMDVTLDKCENGECSPQACPDPAFPYECPSNGECVANSSQCCPVNLPARCADGSCAATAAQCPTCGSGQPLPDDSTVWGCRFSNSYSSDSCADFPECEGWPNDQAAIQAACLATGNGAANCVCTRGNSCQVERAMTSGSTRCTFNSGGKDWYAFGMPSIGCSFGGGSGFINSPICTEYCE